MNPKRRVRRTVGDVVAIPLGGGRVGFGLVLEEPLVAFFDHSRAAGAELPVEAIVETPIAFRIWVMNQPIWDGVWPVIGRVDVPRRALEKPWFVKQDPISGKVTVGRTGSEEITPPTGLAETLERAAVWGAEHVVDRLNDHFAGRANKWVESVKLKR